MNFYYIAHAGSPLGPVDVLPGSVSKHSFTMTTNQPFHFSPHRPHYC